MAVVGLPWGGGLAQTNMWGPKLHPTVLKQSQSRVLDIKAMKAFSINGASRDFEGIYNVVRSRIIDEIIIRV